MLVIVPIIYGRINEIISGRDFVSWNYIFNKYFLKYIGLLITITLIMGIPVVLLTISLLLYEIIHFPKFFSAVIFLLYQLIGLYAVPLLFYENNVKQSLALGFKCLIGNFKFNLPLIFLSVLISLLGIPVTFKNQTLINALFHYLSWGITFVAEFIIFIAITLILRDKIYSLAEI